MESTKPTLNEAENGYYMLAAGFSNLNKMAAKRKYARMGEKSVRNECTNRKCKWQGKDEEKAKKRIDEYVTEDICPKCGKNEFYGLLQ